MCFVFYQNLLNLVIMIYGNTEILLVANSNSINQNVFLARCYFSLRRSNQYSSNIFSSKLATALIIAHHDEKVQYLQKAKITKTDVVAGWCGLMLKCDMSGSAYI